MLFVIDLDTLEIIEGANDKRRVNQREASRGDDAPFEVHFVRAGAQQQLPSGAVLTFAAKADLKFDGPAVVLQSGFTLTGSGSTAEYAADVDLATVPLDALLEVDGDDTNDLPFVDLMGEFSWQVEGSKPTTARRFRFRVNNDVYRGGEGTPSALPDPEAWMPAPLVLAFVPVSQTADGYPGAIDISGDLMDGADAVVFPRLPYLTEFYGSPSYNSDPLQENPDEGGNAFYREPDGTWYLTQGGGGGEWTSTADVASPDLVPSGAWHDTANPHAWRPVDGATGTPVVTSASPIPDALGQLAKLPGTPNRWWIAESLTSWREVFDVSATALDGKAAIDGSNITDPAAFRGNLSLSGYGSGGALAALKATLIAYRSAGIAISGDSTGNQSGEWVALFADFISDRYPSYTVRHEIWSGTAWSNLTTRAGGAGERGWRWPTSGTRVPISKSSHDFGLPQGDDMAMEAKIKVEQFALAGPYLLQIWNEGAHGGTTAERLCAISYNTSKVPSFVWYNKAAGFNSKASTSPLPYVDGDTFWLRVELDADNGAAGHSVVFKHRATDTAAWTTMATVTTAGVSTLRTLPNGDPKTGLYYDVNGGTTLYRANIFDTVDVAEGALPMTPIDHFDLGSGYNTAELVGSPEFVIRNQSVPGWEVRQFLPGHGSYVAWTKSFARSDEGILAVFVSLGHNLGAEVAYSDYGAFAFGCAQILTQMQTRFPKARRVYVAQSPQNTPSAQPNDRQALRMAALIQQAGVERGGLLNAFQAFHDDGREMSDLVVTASGDYIHPTAAGSSVWAQALIDSFLANTL